jgi:protein-tyrosine phosphatase
MRHARLFTVISFAVMAIVCAAETALGMDQASPRADDASTATSEHALGLAGAPNFRDVGGYTTVDGRHVRSELLFRSGELSKLTPADVAKVADLHLTTVIDLRTREEREHAPSVWMQSPEIYESPQDSLAPIMHGVLAEAATGEGARNALIKFYAGMPDMYRVEYAQMFHRLAAGRVPMLVHCTAGKDRTGVAMAILLSALGVPRQTVVEDYRLTERLVPAAAAAAQRPGPVGGPAAAQLAMSRLPEESRIALWRSDPIYIESALASIDREYGSIDAYLKQALDLSPSEFAALRREFLH